MVRTLAGGLQMNPPVRRRKNQYIPPIQTAKPARSIRHQPAKLLRRSPNSRTACRMPARDLALSLSHTLETGERAPGPPDAGKRGAACDGHRTPRRTPLRLAAYAARSAGSALDRTTRTLSVKKRGALAFGSACQVLGFYSSTQGFVGLPPRGGGVVASGGVLIDEAAGSLSAAPEARSDA
jgi:hypothetical protein